MCLAVPGRIVRVETAGENRLGYIDFAGITRQAYLDFVPEAGLGDYVMVHVGFAISKVDPDEAARTYQALRDLGQLAELEDPPSHTDSNEVP